MTPESSITLLHSKQPYPSTSHPSLSVPFQPICIPSILVCSHPLNLHPILPISIPSTPVHSHPTLPCPILPYPAPSIPSIPTLSIPCGHCLPPAAVLRSCPLSCCSVDTQPHTTSHSLRCEQTERHTDRHRHTPTPLRPPPLPLALAPCGPSLQGSCCVSERLSVLAHTIKAPGGLGFFFFFSFLDLVKLFSLGFFFAFFFSFLSRCTRGIWLLRGYSE